MCQVVPVENLNIVPGAWETLTEVTELSWDLSGNVHRAVQQFV